MKKITILMVIVLLTIAGQALKAQGKTEFVMFSQNKCYGEHMENLVKMMQDQGAPILDEVVAEGAWISWGILEHSWGDEWNWNIMYVAENREKFFEGWNLMIKKINEKYPTMFQESQKFCFEHKDNIYFKRMGSGM